MLYDLLTLGHGVTQSDARALSMALSLREVKKERAKRTCGGGTNQDSHRLGSATLSVRALFSDIVLMATGGPFYPLNTGRRDSTASFSDSVATNLPSPNADLSETLASFSSRGFDERETVSLLDAHSIGVIHCKFFQNRLYNFGGTDEPDPTLDSEFLSRMGSKCPKSHSSTSASPAVSPSFDGSSSPTSSITFILLLTIIERSSINFISKIVIFTEGSRNGDDL
ncbi:hypothetical protein REPUB_Repub15cG0134900 [Reevesia pubescens]